MIDLLRRVTSKSLLGGKPEVLLETEWLVTNGLGGYAAGTVCGASTRRYHGLLVAALPAPLGRWMMLNHLLERLRMPDQRVVQFGSEERVGGVLDHYEVHHLEEFRLHAGLPVWTYRVDDVLFERRLWMAHGQNTVFVHYSVRGGLSPAGVIRLKLRPSVHFRPHDAPVSDRLDAPYRFTAVANRYELSAQSAAPPLRMMLYGGNAAFTIDGKQLPDILFRVEASRGYSSKGDLWSPGHFRVDVSQEQAACLVASTEPWESILALDPDAALSAETERRRRLLLAAELSAQDIHGAELVLAADQFIFTPVGRPEDAAQVRAAGDELRSIVAGYHWFTDWGRDTMISLEGLTLLTGRWTEAGYILRAFAHYIRDGLIPNLFPEGQKDGLYHTADATLWFFHALDRYVQVTGDRETLRLLLPQLRDVVDHHLRGTRFGIGVDAADGLLRQGAAGYQLTWMDAKVGDWVVTPRRGKAVEINALWYNALRRLEGWLEQEHEVEAAEEISRRASLVYDSFNQRFWYAPGGYLFDVVDGDAGDDHVCRPNQIFSIALPASVLAPERWESVLRVVQQRLLTPVGLRSLAPGSPEYKSKYYGDLRSRDAAYHQGTVWPWLMGPFVDAWLRVHPSDQATARTFVDGLLKHLGEGCVGSVSEIFDAEEPYIPRGCVAQAWSVAELLRALSRTEPSSRS